MLGDNVIGAMQEIIRFTELFKNLSIEYYLIDSDPAKGFDYSYLLAFDRSKMSSNFSIENLQNYEKIASEPDVVRLVSLLKQVETFFTKDGANDKVLLILTLPENAEVSNEEKSALINDATKIVLEKTGIQLDGNVETAKVSNETAEIAEQITENVQDSVINQVEEQTEESQAEQQEEPTEQLEQQTEVKAQTEEISARNVSRAEGITGQKLGLQVVLNLADVVPLDEAAVQILKEEQRALGKDLPATDIKYANAYKQVTEVLKTVIDDDYYKIPQSKIEIFEKNANNELDFKFDTKKTLHEQGASEAAIAIITILFRDYWSTEEQKQNILEVQQKVREKIEEEKVLKAKELEEAKRLAAEAKQETDKAEEITTNNETEKIEEPQKSDECVSLVEYKKTKWYKKAVRFLKKLFKKDKYSYDLYR